MASQNNIIRLQHCLYNETMINKLLREKILKPLHDPSIHTLSSLVNVPYYNPKKQRDLNWFYVNEPFNRNNICLIFEFDLDSFDKNIFPDGLFAFYVEPKYGHSDDVYKIQFFLIDLPTKFSGIAVTPSVVPFEKYLKKILIKESYTIPDETKQILDNYKKTLPNVEIKYVPEPEPGSEPISGFKISDEIHRRSLKTVIKRICNKIDDIKMKILKTMNTFIDNNYEDIDLNTSSVVNEIINKLSIRVKIISDKQMIKCDDIITGDDELLNKFVFEYLKLLNVLNNIFLEINKINDMIKMCRQNIDHDDLKKIDKLKYNNNIDNFLESIKKYLADLTKVDDTCIYPSL
jgi:hypothetical protein